MKRANKLSNSWALLCLIVLALSCKKNPVSPKPPTTVDTTSHNFVWQTFTLGDGNSSLLNDVAIINDTLIFGVGQIYVKDSTGQFEQQPHNLVIWDGHGWNLKKLFYQNYPSPIKSIFAVSDSDVWLDPWFHWDGHQFSDIPIDPVLNGVGVNRMWGSSAGLYVVGDVGFIANHTGVWKRIASNTNYNILNIWGSSQSVCCITAQSKILVIRGNFVQDTMNWNGGVLSGIWFGLSTPAFVTGLGIWTNNGDGWTGVTGVPSYFYTGIRGSAGNDVIAIAWNGVVLHYNGSTWHQYSEIENTLWDFESLSVKNGMVAIVGEEGVTGGGKAIAVVGRRIQ